MRLLNADELTQCQTMIADDEDDALTWRPVLWLVVYCACALALVAMSTYVSPDVRVSIVYFAHVRADYRWRELITAQMTDLVDFGLMPDELHAVLTSDATDAFDRASDLLLEEAGDLITHIHPRAIVHRHMGNTYEYQGVRLLWGLAQRDPENHILLYFHSKGMANHAGEEAQARTHMNQVLTDAVIRPWREVLARFHSDPPLMKAGYIANRDHVWMWYNFFWVRASYLRRVVRPLLTGESRWYYEEWLARINTNPPHQPEDATSGFAYSTDEADSLSLCAGNVGWARGFVGGLEHHRLCAVP